MYAKVAKRAIAWHLVSNVSLVGFAATKSMGLFFLVWLYLKASW